MVLSQIVVVLHEECVKFGGRGEYPDGWTGTETLPEGVETEAEYMAMPPYHSEGLRYINLGKPFVARTPNVRGRMETKVVTDRHNGMWIPHTLIRRAMSTPATMAA